MALPLLGVPWIIGAGKGLLGLAAKGGASKLAGAAAGAGARRFAGQKLAGIAAKMGSKGAKQLSLNLGDDIAKAGLNMSDNASRLERIRRGLTSTKGFAKNIGVPLNKQELMITAAPDLFFGGMAALNTEGDIVDKTIAGVGSTLGGAGGGLALRGVLGPKSTLGIIGTEMLGSVIGDDIGYKTSNNLIRAKHGGMTPAEQQMAAADEAYKRQLYDQFLAEQGLA